MDRPGTDTLTPCPSRRGVRWRPSPRGTRWRVGPAGHHRLAALLLGLLLAGAACGSDDQAADSTEPITPAAETETASTEASRPERTAPSPSTDRSSDSAVDGSALRITDQIASLPPAKTGLPFAAPPGPQPVGLTIDALGISTAPVLGVGVEDNGDMEIPPADRVGWCRFGASPGEPLGSAVLAAHIAFDGQDGVFVDLDDIELGSVIDVDYDDGSVVSFVATAKEQYDNDELPKESIFDRSGEPQLVLITCGGDLNRTVRSYEDNAWCTPTRWTESELRSAEWNHRSDSFNPARSNSQPGFGPKRSRLTSGPMTQTGRNCPLTGCTLLAAASSSVPWSSTRSVSGSAGGLC